jgi:sorbitol-specific phosphotransferase system component IIA
MQITIKPYNVIDRSDLKEITVDQLPVLGDPLEVDSNMYLICEINNQVNEEAQSVGVIPIVYKTDKKLTNENFLESLSVALREIQHRKVMFNQY